MKYKVILVGAAKFIYNVVRRTVNFNNVDIVAFLDNNDYSKGIVYEHIPIFSVKKIKELEFDYILIGAWHSYGDIFNQLLEMGIPNDKIMPVVKKKLAESLVCKVSEIDIAAMEKIFLPEIFPVREINQVNEICENYEDVVAITETKDRQIDLKKYPLIAHACGGYIKGKKKEYTNSKEAFIEAIDNGFDMFECDVWGVEDNQIILGSRLKMQYPIDIDYTILTLNIMLDMLSEDELKKIILDIKWNTMADFKRILEAINLLIESYENRGFEKIRKQIIIEVFDEETASYSISKGWNCFFTDYRNADGKLIKKTATICCKYGIPYVMMDSNWIIRNEKYMNVFYDKNIKVIGYTTDEVEEYSRLKKIGVSSVLTNYLRPF